MAVKSIITIKEKIDGYEEFRILNTEFAEKLKTVIKANNAERIIVKNEKDETIMEIPLNFGASGVSTALFCPAWINIDFLSRIIPNCVVQVKKKVINETRTLPEKKQETEIINEVEVTQQRKIVRKRILYW